MQSCNHALCRLGAQDAAQEPTITRAAAMLFVQRLRTPADRQHVQELFADVMGFPLAAHSSMHVAITPDALIMGQAVVSRLAHPPSGTPHMLD